jgi:hypothetical protein
LNQFRCVFCLGLYCLLPLRMSAQANGAAAAGLAAGAALAGGASQSASTPSSAGGANAPIEMNIMVYGGIKQIATQIAYRIAVTVKDNPPQKISDDPQPPQPCPSGTGVLLEDSTSTPLLSFYFTWDALLTTQMERLNALQTQVKSDAQQIKDAQKEVDAAIKAFDDEQREKDRKAALKPGAKPPKEPSSAQFTDEITRALLSASINLAPAAGSTPVGGAPATPIGLTYLGDLGTALSTAKSGLSYAASSVQPATQALTTQLASELCRYQVNLYTSASTINLKKSADKVAKRLNDLQELNAQIQSDASLDTTLPALKEKQKTDPNLQSLIALKTGSIKPIAARIASNATVASSLLNSLITWQSGSDNAGSIILTDVIRAQMLTDAIDKGIPALQVNIDAAGGNTRTNSYFLYNLFYTPKPSFNAGVVVTYELRNKDNIYIAGDTLKVIYDYSKWKPTCFAMSRSNEVNVTSLNDGRVPNAKRTKSSFLCENQ